MTGPIKTIIVNVAGLLADNAEEARDWRVMCQVPEGLVIPPRAASLLIEEFLHRGADRPLPTALAVHLITEATPALV